jgi:hypothetical protein
MKISTETVNVLKNFASINDGTMRFNKGNVLRTICPASSIIAEAEVEEVFPSEFVIYDLMTMLGALTLFNDADVSVGEKSLKISGNDNRSLTYLYAEDSMVKKCGKIKESEPFVEFELKNDQFQSLLRATDILKIEHVVFTSEGNGEPIFVKCENVKNPGDNFEIEIEGSSSEKRFKSVHSRKNLKTLPGDYKIQCTDRYSKFQSNGGKLIYWITLEAGLSEV